jgi:hypothetical protein
MDERMQYLRGVDLLLYSFLSVDCRFGHLVEGHGTFLVILDCYSICLHNPILLIGKLSQTHKVFRLIVLMFKFKHAFIIANAGFARLQRTLADPPAWAIVVEQ